MIRDDAIEIWKTGVAAVHGRSLVEKSVRVESNHLFINDSSFDLNGFDQILIVGGGKFSHFMAEGVEQILGEELAVAKQLTGFVTVPDGSNEEVELQFIEAVECRPKGINLPTPRVLAATNRMLNQLGRVTERTLAIALISGGGSALLESSELSLEDIVAATNWLSSRGANIIELNSVRIALSNVKGGGLAHAMSAGEMIGLIVSDVPNDDIRFVSSGPTVDMETDVISDAKTVIERFETKSGDSFPALTKEHLNAKDAFAALTAKVSNFLIGNATVAKEAAIKKAQQLGYEILEDCLEETENCEQISEVVNRWTNGAGQGGKQCVISLGEPVVEPGDRAGQGGRNQHAVLTSIQKLLRNLPQNQFCFLSAGTDGEDGNTPVAGAFVTSEDLIRLSDHATAISHSLEAFDSHTFLSSQNLVFESGPTATNVADLRVLLRQT